MMKNLLFIIYIILNKLKVLMNYNFKLKGSIFNNNILNIKFNSNFK